MSKNKLDYKLFYRRNLPHFQPESRILFITYRLNVPLPEELKQALSGLHQNVYKDLNSADFRERQLKLKEYRRMQFDLVDNYLDTCKQGPHWLKDKRVAQCIVDGLLMMNDKRYDLDCFCIMSNHVHVLMKPMKKEDGKPYSLAEIMKPHKGSTAYQANKVLRRKGKFWHHESFDHYVRDEMEYIDTVLYILNNPVKAGLVDHWEKWPHTWIKEKLRQDLGI